MMVGIGASEIAEEIDSEEPGPFAHGVLTSRHPELIARVRSGIPYPPSVVPSRVSDWT